MNPNAKQELETVCETLYREDLAAYERYQKLHDARRPGHDPESFAEFRRTFRISVLGIHLQSLCGMLARTQAQNPGRVVLPS